MDINQLTISGRIAKINDSKNGVLTFTIATDKVWKNKETGVFDSKTFFFFCSYTGQKRIDKFLTQKQKGGNIVVFGSLENYKIEDKENHIINVQNFK